MRVSKFTDYSLRVMILAAIRYPEMVKIEDASKSFKISRNLMITIIHRLGRGGFLKTQRGRSGGFTLARPADGISIADIVRFGEQGVALVECFDAARNTCVITPHCRLRGVLAEARRAFFAVLGKYTVADASANPEALLEQLRLSA